MADKLSYEDFAQFGDVYNMNGDGGVLKNIMKYTETYPSRHFTLNDGDLVDKLRSGGAWSAVHQLDAARLSETQLLKQVQALVEAMRPMGHNLLLIKLAGSALAKEQLAAADRVVHLTMEALRGAARPLTALLTATGDRTDGALRFQKRQLLAVDTPSLGGASNATFVNISGQFFMYFTGVRVQQSVGKVLQLDVTMKNLAPSAVVTTGSHADGNRSSLLVLALRDGRIKELKLELQFEVTRYGEWMVGAARLLALRCSNCTAITDRALQQPAWLRAPLGFSYHCSSAPALETGMSNGTKKGSPGDVQLSVAFLGLQVQPVALRGNMFGPASDCIGFFTVPILSGLVVTLLLIIVLSYGLAMVSAISTMDRFDDPKAKALQVNVAGER